MSFRVNRDDLPKQSSAPSQDSTDSLKFNYVVDKDRIYYKAEGDTGFSKGEGIKIHRTLGKFLARYGYAKKITINNQDVYVNVNSLAKFVLRKHELENELKQDSEKTTDLATRVSTGLQTKYKAQGRTKANKDEITRIAKIFKNKNIEDIGQLIEEADQTIDKAPEVHSKKTPTSSPPISETAISEPIREEPQTVASDTPPPFEHSESLKLRGDRRSQLKPVEVRTELLEKSITNEAVKDVENILNRGIGTTLRGNQAFYAALTGLVKSWPLPLTLGMQALKKIIDDANPGTRSVGGQQKPNRFTPEAREKLQTDLQAQIDMIKRTRI